jgi:hypothetical protein
VQQIDTMATEMYDIVREELRQLGGEVEVLKRQNRSLEEENAILKFRVRTLEEEKIRQEFPRKGRK